MPKTEQDMKRAYKFLLELSRGNVPMRQCSPWGHLQNDDDKIKDEARNAYECFRALMKAIAMH